MARHVSLLDALREQLDHPLRHALDVTIAEAGARGERLYLVGGGVRDLLLGTGHVDLDLVIEGDALDLARAVGRSLAARVVCHARFGTAVITGAGFRLDPACARAESYAHPGALPNVRPGSLTEDLARRDFTINAMALGLNGPTTDALIDPQHGRDDLKQRLIRVLHDDSFRDDATRALRAVRYAVRLGFEIEPHTHELLRRDLHYVDDISGVRIRHELEYIAREERVGEMLRLASRLGLLAAAHPALRPGEGEFSAVRRLAELPISHRDAVLLCLLLANARPQEVERVSARLALTGRQGAAVRGFVALRGDEAALTQPSLRPSEVVASLARFPIEAIEAFVLVAGARAAGRAQEYLHHWRLLRPRLDGHAIEALGMPHGPGVGEALAEVRAARLDGVVSTRDEEEDLVRRLIAQRDRAGARVG